MQSFWSCAGQGWLTCSNAEGGAYKHGGCLGNGDAAAGVYLVHHLGQVSRRPQDPLRHSHQQAHEGGHEQGIDPGNLRAVASCSMGNTAGQTSTDGLRPHSAQLQPKAQVQMQ